MKFIITDLQKSIFFPFLLACTVFCSFAAQALDEEKIQQGREEAKRMDHIRDDLFGAGKRYAATHH